MNCSPAAGCAPALSSRSSPDRRPVLAAFIGDGPGRAWALMMLVVGVVLFALVALLAFRSPRLRRMQDDLPDVTTPEDRLPRAASGASVPVGVTESAPARR